MCDILRPGEVDSQGAIVEPEGGSRGVSGAGLDQVCVVDPPTERDLDLMRLEVECCFGLHELAEQAGGFCGAETLAEPVGEQAVQGGGEQGSKEGGCMSNQKFAGMAVRASKLVEIGPDMVSIAR